MTFTCPFGTFAYYQLSFGLCNSLATFKRFMTVIFDDLIEDIMEVFMDNLYILEDSFNYHLHNMKKVVKGVRKPTWF